MTPEMVGRTCPYCRFGLEDGVSVIACSACGAVHHDDCWQENGGCAVALCAGGPSRGEAAQQGEEAAEQQPQPATPAPPPLPPVFAPDPATAPTLKVDVPPTPPGEPPRPGGPSPARWVPVLVVAIVLLGGATAAAIVLTKHEERSTEIVTAASSEAGEAGEGEYGEEPGYEEEGPEYEENPGYEEEFEEEEEGGGTEASTSSAQSAQSEVEEALNAHFHRLAYGNYYGAFQDLTAGEQESAGGSSGWVEGQEEDGLESFSLSVETSLLDSHTARADIVDFQTHSLATGCNYWSGFWELRKIYGDWLIDKAKLEKEPC